MVFKYLISNKKTDIINKEKYIIKKILKYYLPDLKYQIIGYNDYYFIEYYQEFGGDFANFIKAAEVIKHYNIIVYFCSL